MTRLGPPTPAPDVPFAFPLVSRTRLATGLRVWSVERRRLPLASVALIMPAGSAIDPEALPGLASLTADMLDEGAAGRSAIEIQEALGRLGTSLDTDAGTDAVVMSFAVVPRNLRRACELLFDCSGRPALAEADFNRIRTLRINRLQQLRNSPAALADHAFLRQVFDRHPYGHPRYGLMDAVSRMRIEDVAGFHASAWDPSHGTLVVVGAVEAGEVARIAEDTSSRWISKSHDENQPSNDGGATADAPARRASSRVVMIDRPGAAQTELRIGHLAVPRSTPDYHALVLLNAVLGGQFVSRINLNLRERKGYTYGAHSAFDFRRRAGSFVLDTSVQTDATADAVHESIEEIRAICADRPPTDEEVAFCSAALTRGYARNFETTGQLARALAQLAAYDLPDDTFDRFVPGVQALQACDLTGLAAAHLDPHALCVIAVGDRARIEAPLADLGIGDVNVVQPEV